MENIIIATIVIIIGTVIILFLIYACAILGTRYVKKCSTEDAAVSVNRFLDTICNVNLQPTTVTQTIFVYPVHIGYNGFEIRYDLVANAFTKLSKYWHIYYFDCVYTNHPNLIIYQFRIYDPVHPELKLGRLASLVQNITEEALANHMHEWDCFVPVDPFVAVRIKDDMLQIAISTNDNGFKVIANMRKYYY